MENINHTLLAKRAIGLKRRSLLTIAAAVGLGAVPAEAQNPNGNFNPNSASASAGSENPNTNGNFNPNPPSVPFGSYNTNGPFNPNLPDVQLRTPRPSTPPMWQPPRSVPNYNYNQNQFRGPSFGERLVLGVFDGMLRGRGYGGGTRYGNGRGGWQGGEYNFQAQAQNCPEPGQILIGRTPIMRGGRVVGESIQCVRHQEFRTQVQAQTRRVEAAVSCKPGIKDREVTSVSLQRIDHLGAAPFGKGATPELRVKDTLSSQNIEVAATTFIANGDMSTEFKSDYVAAMQKAQAEAKSNFNALTTESVTSDTALGMVFKHANGTPGYVGKDTSGISLEFAQPERGVVVEFDSVGRDGKQHHFKFIVFFKCGNVTLMKEIVREPVPCPPSAPGSSTATDGGLKAPISVRADVAALGGDAIVLRVLRELGNPNADQILDGTPGGYLAQHVNALPEEDKRRIRSLQQLVLRDRSALIPSGRVPISEAILSAERAEGATNR